MQTIPCRLLASGLQAAMVHWKIILLVITLLHESTTIKAMKTAGNSKHFILIISRCLVIFVASAGLIKVKSLRTMPQQNHEFILHLDELEKFV